MVVVGIDSPAANQQTEHLEPGPGQQTARLIHLRVQALVTHSIKMEIDRLPGHSGISGNHNADCQVNNAWDAGGDKVKEQPYTSASNMAGEFSINGNM